MAGLDIREHPELDAMLERVKLTRGSDDKLSSEVCGVIEYLIGWYYGYMFWFDLSGLILNVIILTRTQADIGIGMDEAVTVVEVVSSV